MGQEGSGISAIIDSARALKRGHSNSLPKGKIDLLVHDLTERWRAGLPSSAPTDLIDTAARESLQALLLFVPDDGALSGDVLDAVAAHQSEEWMLNFLEEEDLVLLATPKEVSCLIGFLGLAPRRDCLLVHREAWERVCSVIGCLVTDERVVTITARFSHVATYGSHQDLTGQ